MNLLRQFAFLWHWNNHERTSGDDMSCIEVVNIPSKDGQKYITMSRKKYVELIRAAFGSWGAILPRLHMKELRELMEEKRYSEAYPVIKRHYDARRKWNKEAYAKRKAQTG